MVIEDFSDFGSDKNHSQTMDCPNCKIPLHMTSRQNIEIDYCPQCRGVWLDRGELDKIIERSLSEIPASQVQTEQPPVQATEAVLARPRRDKDYKEKYYKKKYQKKRKSWLSEIIDIID